MDREAWFDLSEHDENVHCLCTFPAGRGEQISPAELRSMAYLGAAVALARQGILSGGSLPGALPAWIRESIERAIPVDLGGPREPLRRDTDG